MAHKIPVENCSAPTSNFSLDILRTDGSISPRVSSSAAGRFTVPCLKGTTDDGLCSLIFLSDELEPSQVLLLVATARASKLARVDCKRC